jgi:hypothetical protein
MASTRIDDAIPTECRDTIVPTPTAGGHWIDNATVGNVEDTRGEYVGGGFGHDTSVEVIVLSPNPSDDGEYDAVNKLDALSSLRQSADVR